MHNKSDIQHLYTAFHQFIIKNYSFSLGLSIGAVFLICVGAPSTRRQRNRNSEGARHLAEAPDGRNCPGYFLRPSCVYGTGMKRLQKYTFVLLVAAALAAPVSAKGFFSKLFGKSSTTSGGAVGADREQLMLVSAEDMDNAAKEQYAEVLKEAEEAKTLNTDKAVYERVNAIAKKLIAQTGVFREDALAWDWQVNVITEETVNAWCMPGGKIVVYTGIIDSLNLTDGELAAVMGHEISHALKEHSREQASKQYIQQAGISVVSQVAGLSEAGQTVLAYGTQFGLTLPFSRECETEADNMGTELMARAGYDPHEAINVWNKMNALGGASVPQILSTHPSNDSRIKNLTTVAETVYPLYVAASKKK